MQKKQNETQSQTQTLKIDEIKIEKLDDEALQSVAGGCSGMRFTCTCTEVS